MKVEMTDKKFRENPCAFSRFNGRQTIFKYGTFLVEAGWTSLLVCTLKRVKSTRGSLIPTALFSQPTALSLYVNNYPLFQIHLNIILQPMHEIFRLVSSLQYFKINFKFRKHFLPNNKNCSF
jgi:hypothetical protein